MIKVPQFVTKRIYKWKRDDGHHVGGFINAKKTINEAAKAGLSVTEYVELSADDERKKGRTHRVVERFVRHIDVENNYSLKILEVGPGTGRYLEEFSKRIGFDKIASYEIYETAEDWKQYLLKTYSSKLRNLIAYDADGKSLCYSEGGSVDVVYAHAVLVYLRPIQVMNYIKEMTRVVKKGGSVLFDYLPEEQLRGDGMHEWINGVHQWPVFFHEETIRELCFNFNLKVVDSFDEIYGHGVTRYVHLEKL